ncbi:MAG: hypothetical protein PHY29_02740 [Syntrophales bacterium]|nr:hypothetical protein [Syntrophales bacterium]
MGRDSRVPNDAVLMDELRNARLLICAMIIANGGMIAIDDRSMDLARGINYVLSEYRNESKRHTVIEIRQIG